MYVFVVARKMKYFDYFGPATTKECEDWVDREKGRLMEVKGKDWVNENFNPYIVSNRDAKKWEKIGKYGKTDYWM